MKMVYEELMLLSKKKTFSEHMSIYEKHAL